MLSHSHVPASCARFKADGTSGDCKVAIDSANMFMAGANTGPIPGISIALRPDASPIEVELTAGFVITQVDAIVLLDATAAENNDALEWLATEQVQHMLNRV